MAYSVRVQQVGETGAPWGRPVIYEAEDEWEALAVATYEVDIGRSGPQRVATVFNGLGKLVLAYAGRARDGSDATRD